MLVTILIFVYHAVGLTERGYYKVKFQNLEQKKIVRDVMYKEHQSVDKKFFCVVTFVECLNNRRHRVQGETLPTISDAKESAAQHAVNDLGKIMFTLLFVLWYSIHIFW